MSQSGILNISTSSPTVPTQFDTDSGSATPASNVLTIAGGSGIQTSGAGSTVTVDVVGGGFAWSEETGASAALVAGTGVFANRGTLVTLTLPAVVIGDVFKIVNKGAGLVRIAQNDSDQIIFGSSATTSGATGYLEATGVGDAIEIVALAANELYVSSSIGNWTVN